MSGRQCGATLLMCVIMLASLSLLAVSAASDSLLQQRMGANRAMDEQSLAAANARLRAFEIALLALPGETRPPGCPEACLMELPAGVLLEEIHFRPADGLGQPDLSYFLASAREPVTGPAEARLQSMIARPWGDAAWSGDETFCNGLADTPCGRQGWQRLP